MLDAADAERRLTLLPPPVPVAVIRRIPLCAIAASADERWIGVETVFTIHTTWKLTLVAACDANPADIRKSRLTLTRIVIEANRFALSAARSTDSEIWLRPVTIAVATSVPIQAARFSMVTALTGCNARREGGGDPDYEKRSWFHLS